MFHIYACIGVRLHVADPSKESTVKHGGMLHEFVREGPRVRYGREREVGIETQTGLV